MLAGGLNRLVGVLLPSTVGGWVLRQGGIRCWCYIGTVSGALSLRVMGSCLACHGKRDRGTLDRGFQQRLFHRQCEPNGGIGGSIWLGSGWNSNPRSRCTVDGGGVDLGSSSGSGVDFRAGLPAGHRIGWGVDEGVSRAVISFVVTHRSMLSGYWG